MKLSIERRAGAKPADAHRRNSLDGDGRINVELVADFYTKIGADLRGEILPSNFVASAFPVDLGTPFVKVASRL
jgi:hypothetical protein